MESKFKLPTETVELPSKGLLYPEGHALSTGTVEMKYMTAKEEDILTNQNYIKNGTVIDKLLQSMIVTEFNYDELLIGDKNAIMIAARILSYGKEYPADLGYGQQIVDLSQFEHKQIEESIYKRGINEFTFTLPTTDNVVTFKLLSHGDEKRIEQEVKGLQKINKDNITEATTRLKHIITSINGSADRNDIREFVDFGLLARDARALREEYNKTSPDIDLNFTYIDNDGTEREAVLPITITFFWPES
tara:strand:- start:3757 stop:4497 length:741 start_codon:yes stop_codon:yes gene_type:complete